MTFYLLSSFDVSVCYELEILFSFNGVVPPPNIFIWLTSW
jgi:hypothetical protein